MGRVTAVDGGFIDNIEESNRVIREIVESRNRHREEPPAAAHAACAESFDTSWADDVAEIAEEVRQGSSMDGATPMPEPRDEATNPKDLVGTNKLPLHLWPTVATAMGSIALLNGALKYGRSNWREVGVRASIYVDACQRHLAAWFEGEEEDEEGVPHLGAALACLAIIVDCQSAGLLRDDRQYPGGHRETMARLTKHVARLRELHADRDPKHYTIQDVER